MKFGIFYELQLPRPWGQDDERQLYQNALTQVELADAAGIGLVDQLGGLGTAMAVARQKASLPEAAAVRLYPRTHPLERLRPPDSSEARPAAATGIRGLFAENWGPVSGLGAAVGLSPQGPLMLPGRWVIQ